MLPEASGPPLGHHHHLPQPSLPKQPFMNLLTKLDTFKVSLYKAWALLLYQRLPRKKATLHFVSHALKIKTLHKMHKNIPSKKRLSAAQHVPSESRPLFHSDD